MENLPFSTGCKRDIPNMERHRNSLLRGSGATQKTLDWLYLGLLDQPRDPDEDNSADESHDDGTNDAPAGPDVK